MKILITHTWNTYLDLIPEYKKDIYYTEEYVKLYADKNHDALCYVCIEDKSILLMPIIRSTIDGTYFDFETPYGYGGPITNCTDLTWITRALTEMQNFFSKEGYVAGLIRFHPLLKNADFCQEVINICLDRHTIFIDLSESLDTIWSNDISSKNRNMIRKAEKSGFSFVADFKYDNIDKFIELYNITMQKVSADSFYCFQKEYYDAFLKGLKCNSFLGLIKKDEQIVSAALFMYNSIYGHYHLAGSEPEFSGFGINNLLLWNVVKTLRDKGIRCFHLGGGTNSDPENSLYKFKKSFSNKQGDFYIGKMIFNQEKYAFLCSNWKKNNPNKVEQYKNRLLKYRY